MSSDAERDPINWEDACTGDARSERKGSQTMSSSNRRGRGFFWEAVYSPVEEAPTEEANLDCLTSVNSRIEGRTGFNNRIIQSAKDLPKIESKTFDSCDFSDEYVNFTFKNCHFNNCNFNKGKWTSVKFTECHFIKCNFSFSDFIGCIFRDCTFELITVSSDHLVFDRTSISARAFVSAIYTNTQHLPDGYSVEHQQYRLRHTKAKVAQAILQSTQQEPDPDLFFEAYEIKALTWLEWEIHQPEFLEKDDKYTGKPIKRNALSAFLRGINPRIELYITLASGFITAWGRSIMRPVFIMAFITAASAIVYYCVIKKIYHQTDYTLLLALQRAIDISVVAGYTKYTPGPGTKVVDVYGGWLSYFTTLHMLLGVYWYALIVPVIVRKILR